MTPRLSLLSRASKEIVLHPMFYIGLLVCMPRGSTVRLLIGGIEHTDALFDELREAGKEDKLRQWVGTPAFRNDTTANPSKLLNKLAAPVTFKA